MKSKDKFFTHAIILMSPQIFHLLFKVQMVNRLPRDYSVLGAMIAMLAILATPMSFATTWSSFQISRLRVENRGAALAHFIRRNMFYFALAGVGASALSALIGLAAWGVADAGTVNNTLIFSAILAFAIFAPLLNGILQGIQKYVLFALYVLIFSCGKVAYGALFVELGLDVTGGALAILCAHVSAAAVAVGYVLTHCNSLPAGSGSDTGSPARLRYMGVAIVSLTAMALFFFADEVVMRLCSARHADLFSAAKNVGLIFVYIPVPLLASMFPKVTEAYARGERTAGLFWKCLIGSAILWAAALALIWFIPGLLEVMTGSGKYPAAAKLAIFYSVAIIPLALTNVVVQYGLARGRKGFLLALIPCSLGHLAAVYAFRATAFGVTRAVSVSGLISAVLICAIVLAARRNRPRAKPADE